jgi:hypothetical protein
MIEQWILDKLEKLNGSSPTIIRDPQRIIISGAQVVDGWAEEHGYTVLFCTGNLALREMYASVCAEAKAITLQENRIGTGILVYPLSAGLGFERGCPFAFPV